MDNREKTARQIFEGSKEIGFNEVYESLSDSRQYELQYDYTYDLDFEYEVNSDDVEIDGIKHDVMIIHYGTIGREDIKTEQILIRLGDMDEGEEYFYRVK